MTLQRLLLSIYSVRVHVVLHVHVHVYTYSTFPPPYPHAVKSFVEMARYLLSQPGEERLTLLSERFSQDPLENYFGKQRARGGRCDNPTLKESLQNAVAIRAQRSMELDRVQGNCRRKRRLFDDEPPGIDCTPLPKRKRSSKT